MLLNKNKKGITLVEVMVTLGIFFIISVGATWFVIKSNRDISIMWDQLSAQSEGRKAIKNVINDVRRAEVSSVGSFPLDTVNDYELIFYANIDDDSLRERVRFWVDGTTLKKGIIKPSGDPLSYTGIESVTEIAHYVVNISKGVPVFNYFDESYIGNGDPLTQPVSLTDVHVVRVQLELEKDPDKTPVPLHIESTTHIRNLKTN